MSEISLLSFYSATSSGSSVSQPWLHIRIVHGENFFQKISISGPKYIYTQIFWFSRPGMWPT